MRIGPFIAACFFATDRVRLAQDVEFAILFTNVHVFDGINEDRMENAKVLVIDNLIAVVSSKPLVVAIVMAQFHGAMTVATVALSCARCLHAARILSDQDHGLACGDISLGYPIHCRYTEFPGCILWVNIANA